MINPFQTLTTSSVFRGHLPDKLPPAIVPRRRTAFDAAAPFAVARTLVCRLAVSQLSFPVFLGRRSEKSSLEVFPGLDMLFLFLLHVGAVADLVALPLLALLKLVGRFVDLTDDRFVTLKNGIGKDGVVKNVVRTTLVCVDWRR